MHYYQNQKQIYLRNNTRLLTVWNNLEFTIYRTIWNRTVTDIDIQFLLSIICVNYVNPFMYVIRKNV